MSWTGDRGPDFPELPALGARPEKPAEKVPWIALSGVALIAALAGLLLAWIPSVMIFSFALFPIACACGIGSLFEKGDSRIRALISILLSIVGTFFALLMNNFYFPPVPGT